ncbi:hypothetical protein NPIL_623381, partial [Nephila pilipes]
AVSCMGSGVNFLLVLETGRHDTSDPVSMRNFRFGLRSKIWRRPDCGAIETSTVEILASIVVASFPEPLQKYRAPGIF